MSLGVLKGFFERLREASSAAPATPDEKAGVAAKPAPVLGCTPATPEIRKVEIQSANDAALDPDRWCWPHDPSPDAALNGGEIALFEVRARLFRNQGLSADVAETVADKLVRRDREGDGRVSCAECSYGRDWACPGGRPLPLAMMHRCAAMRPALD